VLPFYVSRSHRNSNLIWVPKWFANWKIVWEIQKVLTLKMALGQIFYFLMHDPSVRLPFSPHAAQHLQPRRPVANPPVPPEPGYLTRSSTRRTRPGPVPIEPSSTRWILLLYILIVIFMILIHLQDKARRSPPRLWHGLSPLYIWAPITWILKKSRRNPSSASHRRRATIGLPTLNWHHPICLQAQLRPFEPVPVCAIPWSSLSISPKT
jgi:hypothetical protein